MSDSLLAEARRLIARAASAAGGGKSPDLVLYALDGARGTLDPAFDAHTLPICAWARAWWHRWQAPQLMEASHTAAVSRVSAAAASPWQVVTGPAAAVVVTAHRLGWDFRSPAVLVTHDGTVLDCRLDPPAAIESHVCEAVRRWRLARICAAFPQILPAVPDLVHTAAGVDWPELGANGLGPSLALDVMDFPEVIHRLAVQRGKAKGCDSWSPAMHASSLLSTFVGGQWPQARVASTACWTSELRCQLCMGEVGTLLHRRSCTATTPVDGWQAAPPAASALVARLDASRRDLLLARALLIVRVRLPPPRLWRKPLRGFCPRVAVTTRTRGTSMGRCMTAPVALRAERASGLLS